MTQKFLNRVVAEKLWRGLFFVLISCASQVTVRASCTDDTFAALNTLSNTINADFANTFTVINALGACGAIPLIVQPDGSTPAITASGYYCLTGDTTNTITINSGVSDVTLDLNNHTITPRSGTDGIDVSSGCSRITIKNGTLSMLNSNGTSGVNLEGSSSDRDFHIYDVNINDGAQYGIHAVNGVTNLDIARVIVTGSSTGFYIIGASNVTMSECNASSDGQEGSGGFSIMGTLGSSVLLDSCIAAGSAGDGFDITGPNVTLTNCVAQGNGSITSTNAGFSISPGNNIMLVNCTATFNIGVGFASTTVLGNVSSFISCIAQNNTGNGFDMSGSGGSGLIMSCVAEGNGVLLGLCGFNDQLSGSLYTYVANSAEGNGINYCPSGAPYYPFTPNTTGNPNNFTPTYWNNMTLP